MSAERERLCEVDVLTWATACAADVEPSALSTLLGYWSHACLFRGAGFAVLQDAYEAARDVVETMNEILSGPLTAIFCVFVGIEILMVSFSRAKQKEGGKASEIALLQFFAVWIGLLIIFLLKFESIFTLC